MGRQRYGSYRLVIEMLTRRAQSRCKLKNAAKYIIHVILFVGKLNGELLYVELSLCNESYEARLLRSILNNKNVNTVMCIVLFNVAFKQSLSEEFRNFAYLLLYTMGVHS